MNWFSLSYKNIYRNKRRSILTAFSIGIVAFVMSLNDGIVNGMQKDMIRNIKDLKTGDFFIQHKDFEKYQLFNPMSLLIDPRTIYSQLPQDGSVKVIENIDFNVTLQDKNDEMNFAKAIAFSMETQQDKVTKGDSVFKLYESDGNIGKLPTGSNEVAITLNLAQKYNINVGDRISILANTVGRSFNGVSYTVTGIIYFSVAAFNADTILFDIPAAQKLLKTNLVTRMLVTTDNDKLAETLIEKISPTLQNEYTVKSWLDSQDASIVKIQNTVTLIISLVFFTIGASIIINTSMMNILERRKEIGMMTSLGTTVKEVRFLFFLESVWLGFLGTFMGILLGSLLVYYVGINGWDLMGEAISEQTGMNISSRIYPSVSFMGTLSIFLFGVIISSVISYLPTGRIAKITPAEAFRN